MHNPVEDALTCAGWPRRHVLKAGAVAVGAALLGRFAHAASPSAITPSEYGAMDAWDMAEAVRKGEVSPQHLLAAAMARCDAVNPKVNAVNMRHDQYAHALLKLYLTWLKPEDEAMCRAQQLSGAGNDHRQQFAQV